jgi:hypothetical protein
MQQKDSSFVRIIHYTFSTHNASSDQTPNAQTPTNLNSSTTFDITLSANNGARTTLNDHATAASKALQIPNLRTQVNNNNKRAFKAHLFKQHNIVTTQCISSIVCIIYITPCNRQCMLTQTKNLSIFTDECARTSNSRTRCCNLSRCAHTIVSNVFDEAPAAGIDAADNAGVPTDETMRDNSSLVSRESSSTAASRVAVSSLGASFAFVTRTVKSRSANGLRFKYKKQTVNTPKRATSRCAASLSAVTSVSLAASSLARLSASARATPVTACLC